MACRNALFLPLFALLAAFSNLAAQPKSDPIADELAVQSALQQGRQLLAKGNAKQAVEALEARLSRINGNADYLNALRDAYSALVRDLQSRQQDDMIPAVQEKLRVLESGLVEKPLAPPPPSLDPPPSKVRARGDDPFQQTPLMDGVDPRELIRRGDTAFTQQRFGEAAKLFAEAHAKSPAALTDSRKADWAFCRIRVAAERLNTEKSDDPGVLSMLERDVTEAISLASTKPELAKYGRTVLGHIKSRQGQTDATPLDASGWTAAESTNFRLLHRTSAENAKRLLQQLEKVRGDAFNKWFGGPGTGWSPRCDVCLHESPDDYAKATGKDPRWQGHSRFEVAERRVVKRRIDLAGDGAEVIAAAAPREVTHLVLADLFPDPLLPRWADEAMAILAEPRENVERYRRALPKVARDNRLLSLPQLFALKDFPDASQITAFYVQSVSVVDMLVAERGAQHFYLFLTQSQRYGLEKALERNYGYKNFAALQAKWQKKAFAELD